MKRSQTPHLVQIGKVMEPRALKGELKIHLFSGQAPWLDIVKKMFLKMGANSIAFSVTASTLKGPQLTVKFKGLNDRTDAEKWVGAEVWISEEYLKTKPGESIYLREILGFKVVTKAEVGTIVDFDSNGFQDLLIVENLEKKKILIPLIKEFLIKIDQNKKIVFMTLPEGLLEVNS